MRNLLSANLSRLFKSKLFWTEIILSAVIGIFINMNQNDTASHSIDEFLLYYAFFIGLFAAVFCSMFLGNEYSNGTIRNKLIVGHSRHAIYLANLVVCVTACLMICISYLIIYCASGLLMVGGINTGISRIIIYLSISIILVISYASIYTIIAMLISSKATASVACLITFIILICFTVYIVGKLSEGRFYESNIISADGIEPTGELMLNPQYLKGSKRAFCEFIFDFLPTGQGYQLVGFSIPEAHLWRLPLYSLLITVITTFCGIFIFKRKDIK